MEISQQKKILIIAGPNGAGKTTFAREYLPLIEDCPHFINADLIAAGLSPIRPELAAVKAGRLMVEEIAGHVAREESFAFESTLSGRGYAQKIPVWRARGYAVKLFYLSLPSAEVAVARVAARAAQGGHSIPEEVIRRRFEASRINFEQIYKVLVNEWFLFDNAGVRPILISEGINE